VKPAIILIFAVPALGFLVGGLALTRFRNWIRDTGVVLLSSSGSSAFVVFTFACMFMTEEFRKMVRPDALTFFSDYLTGGAVIVGLGFLGWLLVMASKRKGQQTVATLTT
jgi:hypothetical protein